jgi:hypothetical protein
MVEPLRWESRSEQEIDVKVEVVCVVIVAAAAGVIVKAKAKQVEGSHRVVNKSSAAVWKMGRRCGRWAREPLGRNPVCPLLLC